MDDKILERFRVTFNFQQPFKVELGELAVSDVSIQGVLEQLERITYTEEDLANTEVLLCDIQDRISTHKDSKEYLNNENKDAVTIKKDISALISKLIEGKKDISNNKVDSEQIKKDYNVMLKGLRILAEVLNDSELDVVSIQNNLIMIAYASKVCVTGFKRTLVSLLTDWGDKISKKFEDKIKIDNDPDILNRTLKVLFCKARIAVANDLMYSFMKYRRIFGGETPHYVSLCTQVLNEKYNLNIADLDIVDSLWSPETKERIKEDFRNFIGLCEVPLLVYDKVHKFFYNELKENKELYEYLPTWAQNYINNNEITEYKGRHIDFLVDYVMVGEYYNEPRYVALREIIRDRGFVRITGDRVNNYVVNYPEKITEIIHDIKLPREIDEVNDIILLNIFRGGNVAKLLDDIMKTKNYNILNDDTIKQLININEYKIIHYLVETGRENLLSENKTKEIIGLERQKDTVFFQRICQTLDEKKISFWLRYVRSDINAYGVYSNVYILPALLECLKGGVSVEIIRELLNKGADINAKDNNGNTALMYAVRMKASIEVIKLLLESGADINAKNIVECTALVHAVETKKPIQVIELLLESGADINAKDDDGETVLMRAVGTKASIEVIELLLKSGADINAKDNNGRTALIHAVWAKASIEVIELLLESGSDIKAKDDDGETVLMYAVGIKASIEVIKLLLESGADINAKDNNGRTVLMYALKNEASIEVIKLLLESGADIKAKDDDGVTALMYAVETKTPIEVIELLLDRGADINAKDDDGNTALKLAMSEEIINLLLDYGANPLMGISNNNPIVLVENNRLKKNVLMYVLEAGRSSEEVKPLLDRLGDIKDMHDINGKTPLMYAIDGNMNNEILDLLITHGANVKEVTNTGETLIMYAVQNSNYHMVQRLCKKGADINARDNNGNTALMYAIMDTNKYRSIKPLLDLGANVGDESIIEMAKKYRGPHIVKILKKKLQQEHQENMQQIRPKRSIEEIVLPNGHSPKKGRYK